jgi:nitroimidazol reductase NimA-like FMN-containing flavoprotein (pyridoxamine 5'-phosphate oxidase superfamily)
VRITRSVLNIGIENTTMAPDRHQVRGNELDEQEINEALKGFGHGTLSLAHDDEAYGVPVSFGYDGDRIFLTLIRLGEESKKLDFAEQTKKASLTRYHVTSRYDWESVIVTGLLQEIHDDDIEYMEEVMNDNAWRPSLFTTASTSPITGVQRMELEIEEATGRKGEEH